MMRRILSIVFLLLLISQAAGADELTRTGVRSISKSGSAGIRGAVTLSEGSGVTLTQVGQDISIAASAGSGDITKVGDCVTGACFDGASGHTITSTTSEVINMSVDDAITLTGAGGTNNAGLSIDLDGATNAVPTLTASANDLINVNDNLSVGLDGSTAENISYAGFAFSGNDLYSNDMLGVNGDAFVDGTLSVLGVGTADGAWTFNTDTNLVYAATENLAITSDLAGTVDVISIIGTPSSSAGTTNGIVIQQADSANTNPLDVGILIDNADTDLALATGIRFTSAAGAITKAIDFDDTDIATEIEMQNAEQIDNNTDDSMTFTGTGGTNNETFTIDLDAAAASGATLSSGNTFVLVNDNLSVGIDGNTTENISMAGYAFSGNDLYVDDKLGVNGEAYFDADVTLSAVTSSAGTAPLYFTTGGTLMTTAEDGAVEMDDNAFYGTTDAGNRGVIPVEHIIRANATRNLTSNTTEQAIFNDPTNGRLTLETGTYVFDGMLYFTNMSATSGNMSFDLVGAGTVTTTAWLYHIQGIDATTVTTEAARRGSFSITQQSVASMVAAGTGTAMAVSMQGTFEVTGAGTLIPSVTMVTASASTLNLGSYIRVQRIGSDSLVSVGQWD